MVVVEFTQVSPDEIEYSGQLIVLIDNAVAATLAKLFFVFVKGAMDRNFDLVMRQPIDLAQLASSCPAELAAVIRGLPMADYQLLAPLAGLLTGTPQ